MSFRWDLVDERERQRHERDLETKNFLRMQQEENKTRKQQEKRGAPWEKLGSTIPERDYRAPNAQYEAEKLAASARSFQSDNLSRAMPPRSDVNRSMKSVYGTDISPSKDVPNGIEGARTQSQLDRSAPPEPTRQFSLDLPTIPNNRASDGLVQEMLNKLRLAEEQLQQERRARSWLETEMNMGKAMLAQLSAKVDKISETIVVDSATVRTISKQLDETDKGIREKVQEIGNRTDLEHVRTAQAISEIVSKQRYFDKEREEDLGRARGVAEDMNQIRYKLEAYTLKEIELANEFRARMRDLEFEQQRGAEAMRAINDHEHALQSIRASVNSRLEGLNQKLEGFFADVKSSVDQEGRARYQTEKNLNELYHDLRKVLQGQEKDMLDRFESTRMVIAQTAERQRSETEKIFARVNQEIGNLEKSTEESMSRLISKFSAQVDSITKDFAQDKDQRNKTDEALRGDLEGALKLLQTQHTKRAEELERSQDSQQRTLEMAVKSLQESITIVEKTAERKINSVEDVLRAEITTRASIEQRLDAAVEDGKQKLLETKSETMARIDEVISDVQASHEKLEDDLKRTAEQLALAKMRSIEDIEVQISNLRKRTKETDGLTNERINSVCGSIEQIQADLDVRLHDSDARMDSRISDLRIDIDELDKNYKWMDIQREQLRIELEERMNVKTVQLDQSLEAFKDELSVRVTGKDVEDLETRLKTSVSSLQNSVSHLVQTMASNNAQVDLRATKIEMDDCERRMKALHNALHMRMVQSDEGMIQVKEDVALRATKMDIEEVTRSLKAAILGFQTRHLELEDVVSAIKDDMGQRALKQQMVEVEERFKQHILQLEAKDVTLQLLLGEFTKSLSDRLTKEDFENEKQMLDQMFDKIEKQIDDVREFTQSAASDINKAIGGDIEELSSNIKAATDTLASRAGELEFAIDGVKLKIADTEIALRARIKEQSVSFDSKLSDYEQFVEANRQSVQDQLRDVIRRIEELPAFIVQQEGKFQEVKRALSDFMGEEDKKRIEWISELRDNLATKVNEIRFERFETEMKGMMQKLESRMDLDCLNIEQLRTRVNEQESSGRDRYRELVAVCERSSAELLQRTKQWRDACQKRLEQVEFHISQYPNILDQNRADVAGVRKELDENVYSSLKKIGRETQTIRNELQTKLSEKACVDIVSNFVSPINQKVQQLAVEAEERGNRAQLEMRVPYTFTSNMAPNNMPARFPEFPGDRESYRPVHQFIPGSFFKPAHLAFDAQALTTTKGEYSPTTIQAAQTTDSSGVRGDEMIRNEEQIPMKSNLPNENIPNSTGDISAGPVADLSPFNNTGPILPEQALVPSPLRGSPIDPGTNPNPTIQQLSKEELERLADMTTQ
ncbi:hypothetical protein BJ742DRAFT_890138 [Cladochytrium replicatum]|nr:hypothetical protein BJ742DRAFT_890138 [Cladochytrium replicatum]